MPKFILYIHRALGIKGEIIFVLSSSLAATYNKLRGWLLGEDMITLPNITGWELFVWATFLILIIAFYKRIWVIEELIEPVLDIFLPEDNVHFDDVYMNLAHEYLDEQIEMGGLIIRVTVKNKSKSKTIKDVRCVLPKIEGQNHAYTNQALQPLAAQTPFQLSATAKEVIGVLFIPHDKNHREIYILYENGLQIGNGLPKKNHRLLIQAQGLDIAPTNKWLVLEITDTDVNAHLEEDC